VLHQCEQQARDNAPGDLVWIPRLTPHWVEARSLSATLTFAFRGFECLPTRLV
jgi:quercetin dioxygenase-like cupin family protein